MQQVTAPRAIVYVDGFNLYYGALKRTGFKWLDLDHLSQLLFKHYEIERIKYFTAPVSARPHDPDQPQRQQTYLRALRTLSRVDIIEGRFYVSYPRVRLRFPPPGGPTTVEVVKTEEKGSDVVSPFNSVAFELKSVATTYRTMRKGPLAASQFASTLIDALGPFTKPVGW